MQETKQKEKGPEIKMSFFDYFFEIIGWLQIVASSLLLGCITGLLIYLSNPTKIRLTIGISFSALGLIIGIIIATRAWKKKGTMHFMSRIMATPDLDNLEKEKK